MNIAATASRREAAPVRDRFCKAENFLRITLLTDRPEIRSQNFFRRHGFYESAMMPMRIADFSAERRDSADAVVRKASHP